MRSLILIALVALAWSADLDALAEQRHRDAVAKREEAAAAAQRAEAERERKAKEEAPAARWVLPKGKPAKTPPAWAQGDWRMGGSPIVIGARTVGIEENKPAEITGVTVGDGWCVIVLRLATLSGPARLVLAQRDGAVLLGGSFEPQGQPDAVEQWQELKPASTTRR
jgi:hypothetical protein